VLFVGAGGGEREGSRPGKRDIGPPTDFFLGTFWGGERKGSILRRGL